MTRSAAVHDHDHCIHRALDRAERVCAANSARLTPVRRRVLELIWEDHKPAKAYDLLEQLRRDGMGSAPPVVYRALSFLTAQGLVHHLSSLNAYVGCADGGHDHPAQFLICRDCGEVRELSDNRLATRIRSAAHDAGFHADQPVVEIKGRCARCVDPGP